MQGESDKKLTPAMRQYMHFKRQYPNAILFFRMGDFYETFYEDAKVCARVLGLALTSRSKGDNAVPLAGVPYHAMEGYLHKMILAGYKVAICEQVEDAGQAKGIVKRDVVRLVTPGTLTEDALLDEKSGNFLVAIYIPKISGKAAGIVAGDMAGGIVANRGGASGGTLSDKQPVGLAWVELSTGQFFVQCVTIRYLLDELMRLNPAECLVSDEPGAFPDKLAGQIKELTGAVITRRPEWVFDERQGNEILCRHFGTANLEGFGFGLTVGSAGTTGEGFSIAAAGVVLDYLAETQKGSLGHIRRLRWFSREEYLQLDRTTMRSLEIERTIRDNSRVGSLLHSIDRTVTAMGGRKLRFWLCYPLKNLQAIERRQDSVAELVHMDGQRKKIRELLGEVADIERINTRICTGRTNPRDILSLGRSLGQLPAIREVLSDCSSAYLCELSGQCDTLGDIAELIERAINPDAGLTIRNGNVIRDGYNAEVDHLRGLTRDGRKWLAEYQSRLCERTGITTLKVGYNKVFGYYVEVTRSQSDKVPVEFVRKQTLKNAERYITEELKNYENETLTAQQRCQELEERLFGEVREVIAAQNLHLQQVADAVANIDAVAGLAEIARERNYCKPNMHTDRDIVIIEGRHPVLEQRLANKFVPNDVFLGNNGCGGNRKLQCIDDGGKVDNGNQPGGGVVNQGGNYGDVIIITGPNMSGKSTYIRQTALLVLMAQTGSFIPAKRAEISVVDRIFTRVGASDELTRGQSTFMVEMIETANILNNATDKSLVILDEIGRGTSTYDGLSLAWAITEYIATQIKCKTLFATHYHEITELADLLNNVRNSNVAVREWKDDVIFLHKIVDGKTDKSYGIHVARLAGIPQRVLSRSKEILAELENNFSREAHLPELGGRLSKPDDGQLLLFDNLEPDPVLEKLRAVDINNLTPMQAINLLHEIKHELEQ